MICTVGKRGVKKFRLQKKTPLIDGENQPWGDFEEKNVEVPYRGGHIIIVFSNT